MRRFRMERSLVQRLYVLSLFTLNYIVREITHFLLGTYALRIIYEKVQDGEEPGADAVRPVPAHPQLNFRRDRPFPSGYLRYN